jgi:hypothetical protein
MDETELKGEIRYGTGEHFTNSFIIKYENELVSHLGYHYL